MKFVDVLFPLPVNNPFTYIVPEELENEIAVGQVVLAKVKNSLKSGIVVGFPAESEIDNSIKYIKIADILESEVLVPPMLLQISKWMAEYYIAFWGETVNLILPPGILRKNKVAYRKKDLPAEATGELSEKMRQILHAFDGNNYMSVQTLKRKSKISNLQYYLQKLYEKGYLEKKDELGKAKAVKMVEYYYTLIETEENVLKEKIRPNAYLQKNVVEALKKAFPDVVSRTYFTSVLNVSVAVLKRLMELGIISEEKKEILREVKWEISEMLSEIELNGEQKKAFAIIKRLLDERKFGSALLWGVTGSGKTQVYIEAAEYVLNRGESVLILVPEISLTPQLIGRFSMYLNMPVAAYHSKLSASERYDIWRGVVRNEIKIVVGARSAMFLPFKKLGLIVVDEEHETSYKQTDSPPRYNASDLAFYVAREHGALYLAGSATPSLESLYLCRSGRMELLMLKNRVKQLPMPKIHVVDLNQTALDNMKQSRLSEHLISEIQARLLVKEQVLLFKNIRGYSSYLQCSDCHSIIKCPKCDVTLTFHKSRKVLNCHYCGYEQAVPDQCPECRSFNLELRGSGTEQIEETLTQLFAKEVLRMDKDTTAGKKGYLETLEKFSRGDADILVGTKMVTKGLDFANLTLVGVLNADMEFNYPDFRATEKGLQALMQVTGRSGRSDEPGIAIVQTFMPEHEIFTWLKKHDYGSFSEQEMANRELLNYPPYSRIILLRIVSEKEETAMYIGNSIAEKMQKQGNGDFDILGPVFAPIRKLQNKFRVHIILKFPRNKGRNYSLVKEYLKKYFLPVSDKYSSWKLEIDVDPVDFM